MPEPRWLLILGAAGLLTHAVGFAAPRTMAIVTSPRVEAFERAASAVRSMAKSLGVTSGIVETGQSQTEICRQIAAVQPDIVLSIGTEAARLSAACGSGRNRIVAMTLGYTRGRGADSGKEILVAQLDVPPAEVARAMRRCFPGKTRLSVIRNPSSTAYLPAEIEAAARDSGLYARVAGCTRAEDLLAAFHQLARQSDLIWCLPDTQLYTGTTVKPLILESLAAKVPLIGFSEGFLRAGAAMAVYPDFDRVAAHTAECVQLALLGKSPEIARPEYFVTGLNRRVLRLMNIRQRPPGWGNPLIFID